MNIPYIQEQLKNWYLEHKRTLPWRNISDPYKIWVSEIILQQTRVAQGYNYYIRFIERFPDVKSLAIAQEDEILKYWQGLGYYSRARNMHAAALQIMNDFGGIFPDNYNDVLKLKGVGEYTAAAICSFAYKQAYPVLDGNVFRVLARLFDIDTPIDSTEGKKEFSALATKILDHTAPDIYNQAIMEFGALQCIPVGQNCNECVLKNICISLRNSTTHLLPIKANKIKTSDRYFNYLFFSDGKHTFLQKRSKKDIWQHLYEFPLIEANHLFSADELLCDHQFQKLTSESTCVKIGAQPHPIKHVLTHQRIYAQLFYIDIGSSGKMPKQLVKVPLNKIDNYAVSRLTELLLDKLSTPFCV